MSLEKKGASGLRSRRVAVSVAGAGLLLSPSPAAAHLVGVEFGDFYAGALHLAIAPEHLASLLALGAFAGLQRRENARWMILALPIGLALGVALALLDDALLSGALRGGVPLDPTLALGLAVPGLLAAAALRLPAAGLFVLAALIGAVHGYANGVTAVEEPVDRMLFAGGVVTSGAVIGVFAMALASVLISLRDWTPLVLRVLGSWVAAVGVVSLGLSLAA